MAHSILDTTIGQRNTQFDATLNSDPSSEVDVLIGGEEEVTRLQVELRKNQPDLQVQLRESEEYPLGCFTVYWKGKRLRIVLKDGDTQLAFMPKDFKEKVEPKLLAILKDQYEALGEARTEGFSAGSTVSFQLNPAKDKFLYTTAAHSNVVMNDATKDVFRTGLADLGRDIKAIRHFALIKSKKATDADEKPALGNQRAQAAVKNLEQITKDPEESTWNPITRIQRSRAKDPRWVNTETMKTYLTALQKKHASDGNYFYYQVLGRKQIDVKKVHIRHPNQQNIPMRVEGEKQIPVSGKLFLPIVSGKHFVSLTVDFDTQKIYFYNSGKEKLEHYTKANKLAQDLAAEYNFEVATAITERDYEKTHQDDAYNCGRYQLAFFTAMASGDSSGAFAAFTGDDISKAQIERVVVPQLTRLIHDHVGAVPPLEAGQLV